MTSVLALLAAAFVGIGPPGFSLIAAGPAGGTVWQGVVPDRFALPVGLPSLVYLPPDASPHRRYRVAILLHGFRGSPYAFVDSLGLASLPDRLISERPGPPVRGRGSPWRPGRLPRRVGRAAGALRGGRRRAVDRRTLP